MQQKVVPAPHLIFEWAAFGDLNTDRDTGLSLGPIKWSAIDRYASRYGIEGDAFERFVALIRAMDGAYLSWQRKHESNEVN